MANAHPDKLSKKIASEIGAIKRIRDFVPEHLLSIVYSTTLKFNLNSIIAPAINVLPCLLVLFVVCS